MTPRFAAKYKRISRDREGLALGIDRQDQDLDALAERLGLTIVGDYFDNDVSASTKSTKPRPGYKQMLADAKAGKFQVILAYTSGRLTRRPRENEDLIDLAVHHGITFEYIRSPSFDLNTAQGRMIARTLAAQDAAEAEEIAERVARQKLQAATSGEWRGGRRPYGYADDGVTVIPDEATEVLRASEAVLRGESLRSIAADMNTRGLKTSSGQPWRQDAIRRVLLRARNAALVEHRGEVLEGVQAAWPAIVPEDTWRAVRAVLTDPKRLTHLTSVRRWMGSGLYICGVCGDVVRVHTSNARGQGKPQYVCKTSKCIARTAAEVDQYVSELVIERLSRPDAAQLLARDAVRDTAELHTKALALRQRLDGLAVEYADGYIDARSLRTGSERIRQQLDQVEQEIADASRGSVLTGLVGADDVAAVWEQLHLDRKRAVVAHLMEVKLLTSGRGRPPGWRPGDSYFRPETIHILWRE